MNRQEYDGLCSLVHVGGRLVVENRVMRYTGQVIGCRNEQIVVEAFGRRAIWKMADCVKSTKQKDCLGPPSNI